MKHLYEYFDCSTMDELKDKVVKEDEQIRPLFNLYAKLKEPIMIDRDVISSSLAWTSFFDRNHNIPKKGDMLVVKMNTKSHVLGYKTFSENVRPKTLFKYLFDQDTVRFASVINSDELNRPSLVDKWEHLEILLSNTGIDLLEGIQIDEDLRSYYSFREGFNSAYYLTEESLGAVGESKSKISHLDMGLNNIEKSIYKSPDFDAFTHEYVKNSLKGLDISVDEDEIKKLLKLGNQHHRKENFGLISYNEELKVNDYSIETIGGINSTIVEPRSVMGHLMNEDTRGVILFHNHPSGSSDPSNADIYTTHRIKEVAELVDKELYDHYIINPVQVLSLADYHEYPNDGRLLRDKIAIQQAAHPSERVVETEER